MPRLAALLFNAVAVTVAPITNILSPSRPPSWSASLIWQFLLSQPTRHLERSVLVRLQRSKSCSRLAHMNHDETELGDNCSKCGGVSYLGGYCFRCGTYRPSKHNLRDEELDASSFMEGNFGKRIEAFYAEADALAESEELTSPDYRPRSRIYGKPQKRTTSPSSQTPSSCAPITPTPLPPPPKPDLSFSELIDIINRRGTTKSSEPPAQQPDTSPPPYKAQNSQPAEAAPTPTPKPDIPPYVSHEPPPTQAHVSTIHTESASTGHIAPHFAAPPRAKTLSVARQLKQGAHHHRRPILPNRHPEAAIHRHSSRFGF